MRWTNGTKMSYTYLLTFVYVKQIGCNNNVKVGSLTQL